MTSDEIRAAFLSFFESKGHKIMPSSSLIPQGDPTLLLTSAGMVPFKPYFLGEAIPPAPRLASCQKCFRTTDIESVGDPTHLTFFEMLGNFSIGDYFKQEAISWAWEFVTQRLGLPAERLWITIFLDDEDAFHYWRQIGVPEKRILRFGEATNFWGPAGDSGPCGPCSEIYYDFGEEVGCQQASCAPGCDCGRFSEIWNLVFTQYNQHKDGQRTLLPKPNIDTGMGLERTAAVVQGKTSVYETELFAPLIKNIAKVIGKNYGSNDETDKAMRVIVEHGRALTFLIADGVMPSNEGRGYVLRRLLRRAALFGRKLGLDRPFLAETARVTIKQMEHIYPEIGQRQDFILKVIEQEEAGFSQTLDTGLEILDRIMNELAAKNTYIIPSGEVFKLYDTYGFPVELTKEIAREHGFSVDLEGFDKEMEKQRERARASQQFENAERVERIQDIKPTQFVGYTTLKHESSIIGILTDVNRNGVTYIDSVDELEPEQEASLILESTPFYGEMGGQVGDTGEIRGSTGQFLVTSTVHLTPEIIVHQGRVTEGSLAVGDEVEAEVDKERRLDIARNHTATHLLQAALRQVLGEHIQQRGSLIAPERLRFDFSHLVAMTKEEIQKVKNIVNESIRQNLAVYDEELPYKKAIEAGVTALFDEKYGDVVRVLRIGRPPISAELCGGTHISTTGEIGFFHIISESSIGAGLRRIEAVTGRGAEKFIEGVFTERQEMARIIGTADKVIDADKKLISAAEKRINAGDKLISAGDKLISTGEKLISVMAEKVNSIANERDTLRQQVQTLERELAKLRAESLLTQAEIIKGITVLVARIPDSRIEILREMSDMLRERLKSVVVVLGTVYQDKPIFLAAVTPDLVTRGYNAGEIVKQVAKVAGGGGGGKATLAQAGGKYKDKLDEALEQAKKYIEEKEP